MIAEMLCGLVQRESVSLSPEIQLIAAGSAVETLEQRTLDVDGERAMLTGASRQRADAAKLMATTPSRLEV